MSQRICAGLVTWQDISATLLTGANAAHSMAIQVFCGPVSIVVRRLLKINQIQLRAWTLPGKKDKFWPSFRTTHTALRIPATYGCRDVP